VQHDNLRLKSSQQVFVMGYDQGRSLGAARCFRFVGLLDQVLHLRGAGRIQTGRRFVIKDDLGIHG